MFLLHSTFSRHALCCTVQIIPLFGCLRYACGGGSHPDLLKVVNDCEPVEKRRAAGKRIHGQRKRKRNSGATDEQPTKMACWEARCNIGKRKADATAMADAREAMGAARKKPRLERWHMAPLPALPEFRHMASHFRAGAPTALAVPISWSVMKRIQAWDQKNHGGTKLMHKLTPQHFERSSAARMSVKPAMELFDHETARILRYLRIVHS